MLIARQSAVPSWKTILGCHHHHYHQQQQHLRRFLAKSARVMSLQSKFLPQGGLAFIDGKWSSSSDGQTFAVTNPYNGEKLVDVQNCTVEDAKKAVQAARRAFPSWAFETTARQRSAILQKWFTTHVQDENELARILTAEQGKPIAEAKGEIAYSASFFDFYAGEARRIGGQVIDPPVLNREHLHIRQPIGVVFIVTPWNFPSAMIARKAAAALAAGCAVVVKPAEATPLSALALAESARLAGLPDGLFNVITADRLRTADISSALCQSPDVDAISFTGSTAVGRILLRQSADTVKRVCLELGGNAPFLVFGSADLDRAVKGAIASKFRCSGQTCVSANRFLVDAKIHDEFVVKLKTAIASLKCGNGAEDGVTQGPLIDDRAVQKVESLLTDAVSKGAKVQLGGKRVGQGSLFEPTLLTGVTSEMQIAHDEIFGPVVAVQKFSSEDEALKIANATRSGLAGYVFSNDAAQLRRVEARLQVGMIGVNEGIISCAEAAFGGVKESGLGREGAAQGIDEFTQWKYICRAY